MAKFLSGPTGKHGTQKIRKHRLKLGITRDMNAAAGTFVNTKSPMSGPGGFYGAAPNELDQGSAKLNHLESNFREKSKSW